MRYGNRVTGSPRLALALVTAVLPALLAVVGPAPGAQATVPTGSSVAAAPSGTIPAGTDPDDQPPVGADAEPVGDGVPVEGQATGADIEAVGGQATIADDTRRRYFGSGPWNAIRAAAVSVNKCSGSGANSLNADQLQAMVLSTIFGESSGATSPGSEPAPMTLSRYDEWSGSWPDPDPDQARNADGNSGLYAFANPSTPYKRAFWHPGIGMWQYDSAGVGAPYTAAERIDTRVLAPIVAAGMADRYCSSNATTRAGKRYDAWLPWSASCGSGGRTCEAIYLGLMHTDFAMVTVQAGFSATGGAVEHSCVLASGATYRCWRIDPAQAQGSSWWATMTPLDGGSPTVAPTPISAPFYVIKKDGKELRYWLAADTGYAKDISGTRTLGKNARPRSDQAGSGVTWGWGGGMCDVTLSRGACGPSTPPDGVRSVLHTITGSYTIVPADIDGDGRDDLVLYTPGPGKDVWWRANADGTFTSRPLNIQGYYQLIVADVDGNGRDDLVFYDDAGGVIKLWRSRGEGTFITSTHPAASGLVINPLDRDGNGSDELLLYGPGARKDSLWTWRTSTKSFSVTPLKISGTYQILIGDFDGNHRDDVFFYGPGAAPDRFWLSSSNGTFVSHARTVSGNYRPRVGDLDGDGKDDILWYAPGSAPDVVLFGASQGRFVARGFQTNGNYSPVLVDLTGAGSKQILWYAPGSGLDYWTRYGSDRSRSTVLAGMNGSQTPIVGGFSENGADGIFWYGPGGLRDYLWFR